MSRSRFQFQPVDAASIRIGIVGASYNPEFADALVATTCESLVGHGLTEENIQVVRVPGSFEVPVVVSEMARSGEYHAVIALGVVVAGDTSHHQVIGQTTAKAILDAAVLARTPVINGILVVDTATQARERVTGKRGRGSEFAEAALHMATLKRNWAKS